MAEMLYLIYIDNTVNFTMIYPTFIVAGAYYIYFNSQVTQFNYNISPC